MCVYIHRPELAAKKKKNFSNKINTTINCSISQYYCIFCQINVALVSKDTSFINCH